MYLRYLRILVFKKKRKPLLLGWSHTLAKSEARDIVFMQRKSNATCKIFLCLHIARVNFSACDCRCFKWESDLRWSVRYKFVTLPFQIKCFSVLVVSHTGYGVCSFWLMLRWDWWCSGTALAVFRQYLWELLHDCVKRWETNWGRLVSCWWLTGETWPPVLQTIHYAVALKGSIQGSTLLFFV